MAANHRHSSAPGSYRFALRPMWILSHLLVLALVVLMINLGLWQLRRLDQRRDFNATVEANADAAPVPLSTLVASLDDGGDVDDIEWRRAELDGTYVHGADVLVANRALDGQPGYWVITPFEPADGSPAVAVVRGFVTRPFVEEGDPAEIAPPSGEQHVAGYVQRSSGGGRFATGLGDDALPEISRVDLGDLAEHWGMELAPVWLQRQAVEAERGPLVAVPLPDLNEGPHLSYAVQWFIFTAIAVVGYPLILRRNAHVRTPDKG
ncbi:MAG TPA: SURF1 family protein [Acidimicrobiales bacterium]